MKNKNWIFFIILAMVMVIISTSIIILIFNNKDTSSSKVSNKVLDELKYLDNRIISMINKLNNLKTSEEIFVQKISVKDDTEKEEESKKESKKEEDSSKEKSKENPEKLNIEKESILLKDKGFIDWKDLALKAEDLYETWTIATLDLATMNISNEDILTFNSNLDNLLIAIKEKNKINSEISLANLYSLLPGYTNEIKNDEERFIINSIKSNVVSAYSIVEIDKWNDVLNLLGNAEENISKLMNDSNEMSPMKKAKINKAYILLKELIKSSNEKNIDLFYFKYINLIKALDDI